MRTTVSGIKLVERAGYRLDEIVGNHPGSGGLSGAPMQPDSSASSFEAGQTARSQGRDHPGEHIAGARRSQPGRRRRAKAEADEANSRREMPLPDC